jgi:uncharacterized membrane protein YkgB
LIRYTILVKKQFKRILYDIAGITLIVISPFLGWIPGPGGIPVFLAGLGLLAVHNDWAHRLLLYLKDNAVNILESAFPHNPKVERIHDIVGVTLVIIAIALVITLPSPFSYLLPIALCAIAIFELLYNQRRYKKFKHKQ